MIVIVAVAVARCGGGGGFVVVVAHFRKFCCLSQVKTCSMINKLREQDWINYNTVQVGGRLCDRDFSVLNLWILQEKVLFV